MADKKAPITPEKEPETAPKTAKKADMIKVKFLRSHPSFAYFAGDSGEISQEAYDKYSKDGEFFEKL